MSAGLDSVLRAVLWTLGRLPDGALRTGSRMLFSRSWKSFLDASERPREVQEARLLAMLDRAKNTAFGKEHGFENIKSLADYREAVPVRGYDGLEPYLRRMVDGEDNVLIPDQPFFFGRSSGTTGVPKHIPVTEMYVAEFRRPRRVFARQVMQAFPGLVRGKFLAMHSPKIEGVTRGGVPYGSITVAMGARPDRVGEGPSVAPFDAVPRSVFLLEDFELKYRTVLRLAAQERITLAATMNPSTLVLLAKKLDQHAEVLARELAEGTFEPLEALPEPIRSDVRRVLRKDREAARRILESKSRRGQVIATEVWPSLVGLLCWKGGSAPFYLRQLATYFPDRPIMDFGFVATEGGFSIPMSPDGAKGVVAVNGHVLEFVPEEEMVAGPPRTFLTAGDLEVGGSYRVIISGSHGLYRYDINDVVRCVGYFGKTAEIEFLHKGGNMLSITGEKLGESHVVQAARRAMEATRLVLVGFCATCDLGDPPRYRFVVESEGTLPEERARLLLDALERGLREVNVEYAAKRDSLRLGAPALQLVTGGTFEGERRRRVRSGAPDSHVKVPHLVRDPQVLEGWTTLSKYEGDA